MFKKVMLFTFLITFIDMQSVMADKVINTSFSAGIACSTCTYTITDDPVIYENDQWLEGFHTVSADIDSSLEVKTLYVTLKLDPNYDLGAIDTILFTGYTTMTTSTYNDANGRWLNVTYTGVNSTIQNVDLFVLHTLTDTCLSASDTMLITFEDLDTLGNIFRNEFVDSSSSIYTVMNLDTASMTVVSPSAYINVYNNLSDSSGTIVDESYVGGQVKCGIFFHTNFDFAEGFEFTLGFDDELQFDSIVTNSFSYGATDSLIDDTTVLIKKTSGGSLSLYNPDSLLIAYFTFDPADSAVSESNYKVRIKGDFTFTACNEYYVTDSNSDSDYVYLSTITDTAAWMFPNSEVVEGTTGWAYYFKLQNSSPIATDDTAGVSNAAFTVDESKFVKVSFYQPSGDYSYYGGVLKWSQGGNADTLKIEEYEDDGLSTWIRPSSSFTNVGYMTFDVGSSIGTDSIEHLNFTDNSSAYYKKDNYVITKYSKNKLHKLDGNLDLISGSITVTSGSGGGGCPMLYTWNGNGYTLENTILTQSQGKSNPEAEDDFYPFALGIVPDDGYYKIQIREYENEVTYLDEIELVTVDYHEDLNIAISNQGEIFSYRDAVAPLSAVDEWGRDLMPYVGKLDDVWMDVDYPGSMILTYENLFNTPEYLNSDKKDTRIMASGLPEPPPNKQKVSVESTNGQGNDITAEIEDANGNWYYLGAIPPREIKSENSKFLFDAEGVDLGETFRIKISWKSSYNADFQALYLGKGFDFTEKRLVPEEVVHSDIGQVKGKLLASDGHILTIEPGQVVDLKFKAENTSLLERMNRRFFLKSHGYYKTLTNEFLPDEFVLEDNYPNPFNPTTIINFSVPVKSDVSIVVFNVLGQEVKTLLDGEIVAGNHQVIWGGDNNSGKQVASGVYLYRLKTGDINMDFPRKNGYGVKLVLSSLQIEPDSCILSSNDDGYGCKTIQYTPIS